MDRLYCTSLKKLELIYYFLQVKWIPTLLLKLIPLIELHVNLIKYEKLQKNYN
jgi:hypothetical protein